MAEVKFSTLPAALVDVVGVWAMPKLGAFTEGVVVLGPESCMSLHDVVLHQLPAGTSVLFEAKCKSLFDGGKGGMYVFTGSKTKPPREVAPQWYAQVTAARNDGRQCACKCVGISTADAP